MFMLLQAAIWIDVGLGTPRNLSLKDEIFKMMILHFALMIAFLILFIINHNLFEYVAQLVEHWTFNPQVLGSNPSVLINL